jgi:hypothetical protein
LGVAGCVEFSKTKHNAREVNILRDLHAARLKSRIDKGAFLLCVTGQEEMLNAAQLPFSLAKILKDCPENPVAGTEILVHWYLQGVGNPNLAFVAGVLSGAGQKPWTAQIPRESVLLINPTFKKNNNTLSADSLKDLVSLRHDNLVGWNYKAGFGLVYEDPVYNLKAASQGDSFVFAIKDVPSGVRRCVSKHQLSVTPFVIVHVVSDPWLDTYGVVHFTVNWFVPVSGDPNGTFKAVSLPDGNKKHATLKASTVRLADVVQFTANIVGTACTGFTLHSSSLEELGTSPRFFFMKEWSFADGRLENRKSIMPAVNVAPNHPLKRSASCASASRKSRPGKRLKSSQGSQKKSSKIVCATAADGPLPSKSGKSVPVSTKAAKSGKRKSTPPVVVLVDRRRSSRKSVQPAATVQECLQRVLRTGDV